MGVTGVQTCALPISLTGMRGMRAGRMAGRPGRYPRPVTLRLHDTATRSVREFIPKTPGQVGIYLCGLTVQSEPHIGHLRSAVNYDVLRRWLLHTGDRKSTRLNSSHANISYAVFCLKK